MLTWIYLLLECFDYPLISTYKVRKSMALLPDCGSFENLSFSQNRLRFKLAYLCNWNWFGQTNKTWYRKQRLITFGLESVSSQLNCSLPVKQAEYLKCRTTVSLQIRTKKTWKKLSLSFIATLRFAKMVGGGGSSVYLRLLCNFWCWESTIVLAFITLCFWGSKAGVKYSQVRNIRLFSFSLAQHMSTFQFRR